MSIDVEIVWQRSGSRSELATVKAVICEETASLCAKQFAGRLCAVVLTGSVARDEGSFVGDGERWKLLGDVEFFLIFEERAALPSKPEVELLRQKAEAALSARGIFCHIVFSPVHSEYLRKLGPHIFAYELRTFGRVVWGNFEVLSLIRSFSPADIPLEDAWRLLSNRMVEQLEVVAEPEGALDILPERLHYRTVKFYLDMATSLLVFAGFYAPSYRERQERLSTLAGTAAPDMAWPFPLDSFARQVTACTEWKLSPNTADARRGWEFCEKAAEYAQLLWRWELARLTGARVRLSDRELFGKCMQLVPLGKRLRGWLVVLRECGWHRSWRQWPRWGRLAWRASPRYWVYAAASQFFFQLPGPLRLPSHSPDTSLDWKELLSWLPVVRRSEQGTEPESCQQVASEIAWNYHQFLKPTRA